MPRETSTFFRSSIVTSAKAFEPAELGLDNDAGTNSSTAFAIFTSLGILVLKILTLLKWVRPQYNTIIS